jgi:two-component system, OmpR family, sensor histidine kinase CiaH
MTYSVMLILMLLLFTVIMCGALFVVISQEQNGLAQSQADEQVSLYQNVLQRLPDVGNRPPDTSAPDDPDGSNLFTYIVSADGKLVAGQEQVPGLRDVLLDRLNQWVPYKGETRLETVMQPSHSHHRGELRLLIAGRAFYKDGQLAGILYTGHDVSFYWDIFGWLVRVLLVLIVLFGVVATLVGQRMAARAMVPIRTSYLKQQQFVADASHELRTPLAVLHSSFDVIELEDGDTLSDISKQVLSDMKEETKSMSRLVADLLTLARSDSGAVELDRQRLDLAAVAEQIVRLRQTLAQEKGIVLSLAAPADLTMIGDPERLKQLLAILVDNALTYSPEGGRVTVSMAEERNNLGVLRAQVMRVEDTGIGIPAEEQERIFERFYRVEEARSRVSGGTGIGLAIAKWIVDAHQGSIEVKSAPGAGSTFTVRIPVTK